MINYFFNTDNLSVRSKNKELKDLIAGIKKNLSDSNNVKSGQEYNHTLEKIIKIIQKFSLKQATKLFYKEIQLVNKDDPLSEKTAWGGVNLKKIDVEKDYINKLLVIKKYGILGFEIHKVKLEELKILEGICLILYSNHESKGWVKGEITVKLVSNGDKFKFLPYDEHGIVALTNCVIEEQSTNHLDDLVYIFNSDQI